MILRAGLEPDATLAQIHDQSLRARLAVGAHCSQDFHRLAILLAPPRHRRAVRRAQAAFDLHRRGRLMNQEMHARRERLSQIEQVVDDRHQHAIGILPGASHRTKKLSHMVDLPPIHDDDIEFLRLHHRQRRVRVGCDPLRYMQLVQNIPRDPQKLASAHSSSVCMDRVVGFLNSIIFSRAMRFSCRALTDSIGCLEPRLNPHRHIRERISYLGSNEE